MTPLQTASSASQQQQSQSRSSQSEQQAQQQQQSQRSAAPPPPVLAIAVAANSVVSSSAAPAAPPVAPAIVAPARFPDGSSSQSHAQAQGPGSGQGGQGQQLPLHRRVQIPGLSGRFLRGVVTALAGATPGAQHVLLDVSWTPTSAQLEARRLAHFMAAIGALFGLSCDLLVCHAGTNSTDFSHGAPAAPVEPPQNSGKINMARVPSVSAAALKSNRPLYERTDSGASSFEQQLRAGGGVRASPELGPTSQFLRSHPPAAGTFGINVANATGASGAEDELAQSPLSLSDINSGSGSGRLSEYEDGRSQAAVPSPPAMAARSAAGAAAVASVAAHAHYHAQRRHGQSHGHAQQPIDDPASNPDVAAAAGHFGGQVDPDYYLLQQQQQQQGQMLNSSSSPLHMHHHHASHAQGGTDQEFDDYFYSSPLTPSASSGGDGGHGAMRGFGGRNSFGGGGGGANRNSNGGSSSGVPHYTRGPIFSNIFIAHHLHNAPSEVQDVLLQALKLKQISVDGLPVNLPAIHLCIATHSQSVVGSSNAGLSSRLLDEFALDIVADPHFFHSLERFLSLPPPTFGLDSGPQLQSQPQQPLLPIPWASIKQLVNRDESSSGIYLSTAMAAYARDVAIALRQHGRVAFGPTPQGMNAFIHAAKSVCTHACHARRQARRPNGRGRLLILSVSLVRLLLSARVLCLCSFSLPRSLCVRRCHAFFAGFSFVRPVDIDSVAEDALCHRVLLRASSGTWGEPPAARRIIAHICGKMLMPPK